MEFEDPGALSQGPSQPFAALKIKREGRVSRNPRLLRRFKLFLAPMLAVLAVGLWLIMVVLWTTVGKYQLSQQKPEAAAKTFTHQLALSPLLPQPWLTRYNLGTALLQGGDLEQGVALLESAYLEVPKAQLTSLGGLQPFTYECSVRMNLSAGLEMQGDEKAEQGQADQAVALYEQALEWVTPCEVPAPPESGESPDQDGDEGAQGEGEDPSDQAQGQGGEAGDRLREKLDQAQQESSGADDSSSSEGESQGQEPPDGGQGGQSPSERERQEKLEQRNREQAERLREEREKGGGQVTGGW